MSITRESFIKGNFGTRHIQTDVHPVTIFLKENPKRAFSVLEISSKTKIGKYAVRRILKFLEKKNLVSHKLPYFLWKTDRSKGKSVPKPKPKRKKR